MTDKQKELLTEIGYDESLAHHGVKGMKWGVRKAPTSKGRTLRSRLKEALGVSKKKRASISARPSRYVVIYALCGFLNLQKNPTFIASILFV